MELAIRARVLRGDRAQRAVQAGRAAAPHTALAGHPVLRRTPPGARLRARATGRLALAIPAAIAMKRPGRASTALPGLRLTAYAGTPGRSALWSREAGTSARCS